MLVHNSPPLICVIASDPEFWITPLSYNKCRVSDVSRKKCPIFDRYTRTAVPPLSLAYREDYLLFAENQAGHKKNIRIIDIGHLQPQFVEHKAGDPKSSLRKSIIWHPQIFCTKAFPVLPNPCWYFQSREWLWYGADLMETGQTLIRKYFILWALGFMS